MKLCEGRDRAPFRLVFAWKMPSLYWGKIAQLMHLNFQEFLLRLFCGCSTNLPFSKRLVGATQSLREEAKGMV